MTSSLLPGTAERRLARELAEIRTALDTLRDSARVTQLQNSTLYGNLTARDADGTVRAVIGVQSDGTWATVNQNGPPPDRPSTPIPVPSMNGAIVTWNGQLVSGTPADLMGVRIYVSRLGDAFLCDDSTYVGTLRHAGDFPVAPLDPGVTYWVKFRAQSTSVQADGTPLLGTESYAASVAPGQVVAAAVLAGIVDSLALAADAVQAANIAANAVTGTAIAPDSISSPHIIAQAIQTLHIAADAIAAGQIAADTITARELAALAVAAEHIQANAIDAGMLQAGIITADKLAALLVLATRIILGDPTGARMELDDTGLDQFDDSGARTLQFGADPAGGNFLTILDPANPSAALASIADNGVITAQSFVVAGSMGYKGGELTEQFDALPKGLITWGTRATGDYTTDMTGIGELEALCEPGRIYRIGHSACFVEPATLGSQPTTQGEMRLHYTTDGSRPTTSSAVLGTTGRSAPGDYGGLMANFGQYITGTAEVRLRILITYQSHFGLSSRFITGGYDNGLLFWIEDVGPATTAGGVASSGAGTGTAATASYTREWTATWTRSWSNGGQTVRYTNGELVQGYYNDGVNGDQVAAFGYNTADIRSALANATITTVQVYLYAHHWYWNSGGQVRLRTHNVDETDTYPQVSATISAPTMGKPEGRWVTLPTSVGDGFKNGTIRGFALDARDIARNLTNYGRFDGIGWGSPPRLRVLFRAAGTGGGTTTPTTDPSLAAPSGFSATWNTTGPTVTTNWTATPGSDSTEVHEFLVDPADTLKATIAYPGGTRTSGNLGGTQYLYAVRARTGTAVGPFSAAIRISASGQSTEAAPGSGSGVAFPAPTNQQTVRNADGSVTTTWTATTHAYDSTEVHEFLVDPSNTLKATITAPGTSRQSGVLAGGREYQYAVRAKQGTSYSGFSNRVRILADGTSVDEGGGDVTGGGTDVDTTTAAGRYGWGNPIAGDEFNYTGAPAAATWGVYNGVGHDGNGRRVPAQVSVDGSKLVGRGLANGDSWGMEHQFSQQYGRWEVRCRSYMTGSGGTTTTPVTRTAGVGGIPAPAAASNVELNTSDRGAMNITASGTASVPRIYDGGGKVCGAVTISGDYIVFQNYKIQPNSQYAVYNTGNHVTIQNCTISNVKVSGDGDLNAITLLEGSNIDVLYNVADNFVSGSPGGSHTDFCQTWVSSSHPTPVNNVRIVGNHVVNPANPSRSDSIASLHQFCMVEGEGEGGNSGGSGNPTNWLIENNTVGDSWGQAIKIDGGNSFSITRNKFVGDSDYVIEITSASSNVKLYSDNTIGSGYGSVGTSLTAGAGPSSGIGTTTDTTTTTPVSNGNDYHPVLIIWPDSENGNDGEYDLLENGSPGEANPEAYLHKPITSGSTVSQFHFTGPSIDLTLFHNFAIEWTSGGITLYVDGVQWGYATGGADSTHGNVQAMGSGHLTMQLDNFDGTDQTPATMEVEWVRAYSLTPVGTGGGTGGGGTTGGGTGSAVPASPAEALWIGSAKGKNHFNVGIGETTSSHVDHNEAAIESGFSSQWFTLDSSKLWVIFKVRIDAATTSSGTKYARSELRELAENGTSNAAWNGSSGTHTHEHTSKVMHVPPNKSSVCFSQIHDASSDLVRLQTEGSSGSVKLVLRNTPPGSDSETVRTVASTYSIGAEVSVKWSVVNGNGTVVINGSSFTYPAGTSGCYFKNGAYAQTNETIDSASETCEVWVKAGTEKTWHTGYTSPTTPVYSG